MPTVVQFIETTLVGNQTVIDELKTAGDKSPFFATLLNDVASNVASAKPPTLVANWQHT